MKKYIYDMKMTHIKYRVNEQGLDFSTLDKHLKDNMKCSERSCMTFVEMLQPFFYTQLLFLSLMTK